MGSITRYWDRQQDGLAIRSEPIIQTAVGPLSVQNVPSQGKRIYARCPLNEIRCPRTTDQKHILASGRMQAETRNLYHAQERWWSHGKASED